MNCSALEEGSDLASAPEEGLPVQSQMRDRGKQLKSLTAAIG